MKESRQRRWQKEIQAEAAGPSIPTSSNGTNVSIQGTGRDLRADYSLKKTVRSDACRIHSVSSIKKLWMSSFCVSGSRSDDSVVSCPKGRGFPEIAPFSNA